MKKRVLRMKEKARLDQEKEDAKRTAKRSSSGGGSSKAAAPTRKDAIYYNDTKKGMLVQRLLVRWWHAYQWPKATDWNESDVPKGYEELDGFPGVFVSLDVGTLGKILDLRDNEMKPSLRNMSSKHAKDVQDLCIQAYEKQMEELKTVEGEDSKLLRTLRRELHQVKDVDPDAAEREARNMTF
jgi:hypothetical protein